MFKIVFYYEELSVFTNIRQEFQRYIDNSVYREYFESLSDEEFEELVATGAITINTYQEGDIIISEDEQGEKICFMNEEGVIRINRIERGVVTQTIQVEGSTTFGDRAAFRRYRGQEERGNWSIEASRTCTIVEINADIFIEHMNNEKAVQEMMLLYPSLSEEVCRE
ncbi:hypothetical protein ACFL56_04015 [Candidatus Margulisiibacteriota bacterium]